MPLVSGNVGIHAQDGVSGVQVLVDSGTTSPGMLVQSGNRGRGRGGRGGRGRGGGRGRRSTSGPPPEIDHNIEVLHQIHWMLILMMDVWDISFQFMVECCRQTSKWTLFSKRRVSMLYPQASVSSVLDTRSMLIPQH